MKTLKLMVAATLIIVAGLSANAQLTGTEIVENAYNRETGDDQTSTLTMTLQINRASSESGKSVNSQKILAMLRKV